MAGMIPPSRPGFDAPPCAVAYWAPKPVPPAMPEPSTDVAISLEAEVPEVLFDGMRQFIEEHPQWDQYRLVTSALAGFLFQHGCKDACVQQHYLNGLFLR